MNYKKLITFAVDIGELMLVSGAETYSVEDTIMRILTSADGTDCQSFVTPTGIFASLTDDRDVQHSYMRRIEARSIHLSKIESANDISRKYCSGQISLSAAIEDLSTLTEEKGYSKLTIIISTSMAACLFAIVLGGTYWDALITLGAGFVLAIFQTIIDEKPISKFFYDLIGGFLTTLTALTLLRLTGFPGRQNIIIISAIMPLVPGVAITNAIRDTLHGHLVSGNARILDAFIVAASIATGVGIALSLFNLLIGGIY